MAPLAPTLTLTRSGLAAKRPLDEEHARWLAEVSSFGKVDAGATNASTPRKAATKAKREGGRYEVRAGVRQGFRRLTFESLQQQHHYTTADTPTYWVVRTTSTCVQTREGERRSMKDEQRSYDMRSATGVTEIKKVSLPKKHWKHFDGTTTGITLPCYQRKCCYCCTTTACCVAVCCISLGSGQRKRKDDTYSMFNKVSRLLICEICPLDKVE